MAAASTSPGRTTLRSDEESRLPRGDCATSTSSRAGPDWSRASGTTRPRILAHRSEEEPAVIGYDDAESVAIKTDWAMKKGLRGVFFWQVHGDRLPDGTNPLQEAVHREWEKAGGKACA